jgi:hypothetical protein
MTPSAFLDSDVPTSTGVEPLFDHLCRDVETPGQAPETRGYPSDARTSPYREGSFSTRHQLGRTSTKVAH